MNDTTASTANNAIVISDDDHVAQPLNNVLVVPNSPINPTVMESNTRLVADEHVDSSTEEEENDNAVQPTEGVERFQTTKSTEGADDDDFRPVKKRKVQENDDVEVDEVRTNTYLIIVGDSIVVTHRASCVQFV